MGECTHTHTHREGKTDIETEAEKQGQTEAEAQRQRWGRGLCSPKGHPISEHLKLYAVNKDE